MTKFVNPFELPSIKTGYNLISFFKKLIPVFKKTAPNLLIEDNNLNIKFNMVDDEFVVLGDYGKSKILDINGFTYNEIDERFVGNDKIKTIYKLLFNIFNSAENDILPILKKLNLFKNNRILNCRYIKTKNGRMIIINDVFETGLKKKERFFEKTKTDQKLIDELVLALQPYAHDINLIISSNLKTIKLSEDITEDIYDDLLDTIYTLQIKPTLSIAKTLRNWLRGCKNPKNKHIKLNDIKIKLFDKKLYFKILNGLPLSEIVDNKNIFNNYKKDIINAFILQLTTQSLGQRLLEQLDLPNNIINGIMGVTYKNVKILGDNIIKNYKYYNEDEQVVNSYISNPPHMTSDWGHQEFTNESKTFMDLVEAYDLEEEPHTNTYTYFIFKPNFFLKNDYDFYLKYSNRFLNNISKIIVPHSKYIKFDYIKESIKSFGINDNDIIEYESDKVNPLNNIYCNNGDKVLFLMNPDSEKYFIKSKHSKEFISEGKMKPYKIANYYKVFPAKELNLLDFKIKTNKQFFTAYAKADDEKRNKLLISMYGNTNLKTLFDKIF